MKLIGIAAAGLGLFAAACSPLDRVGELEVEARRKVAQQHMGATEFTKARDLYGEILDYDPEDGEAAMGMVLSNLLLLPDAAPITKFLTHCNQPHYDFAESIFGENGIVQQSVKANDGEATVTLQYQPHQNGSTPAAIPFEAENVRTFVNEVTVGDNDVQTNFLVITIQGTKATGRYWLEIALNADDVFGNGSMTPLSASLSQPLSALDLAVSINRTGGLGTDAFSNATLTGDIEVVAFDRAPGAAVQVVLSDVRLQSECEAAPCPEYLLDINISDELSPPIEIDPSQFPFGTIDNEVGPPRVSATVLSIEQCMALDDDYVLDRLRELGDLFEADAQRLAFITAADARLTFHIPRNLLGTDRDLPANVVDALMLRASLHGLAALFEYFAQFDYIDVGLLDLVSTFPAWVQDTDGPANEVMTRDWTPSIVVAALNRTFMKRRTADFSMDEANRRFQLALNDLALALTTEPEAEGILNFRVFAARRFGDALADLVSTMSTSLTASELQYSEEAPAYGMRLGLLFDTPPDYAALHDRTGLVDLFELVDGQPSSDDLDLRNDNIGFEDLFENLDDVFEGTITLPADMSHLSCAEGQSPCPTGYVCGLLETCEPTTPWLFTEDAFESLFDPSDGDWPVFLNPELQDAFLPSDF